MKKIILLSSCVLFALAHAFSQQVKVNIGPEIEAEKGYKYDGLLYADPSGYYAIKLKDLDKGGLDLHIVKFDYTHKQIFDHNFTTNKDNTYFESIVQTHKNFHMIFTHDDVDKGVRELYTVIVDHDGNISNTPIPLASFPMHLKKEGSTTKVVGNEDLNFDIVVNGDSTRMLLYASPEISANNPMQYYLDEFDMDGNAVQQKQIKTNYVEAQCNILGYEVDLQDNIYVMARIYKESTGKGKDISYPETVGHGDSKKLNYENKILRYSKGSDVPKEYTMDIDNKILGDFYVSFNKNSDFILTGLYYHTIVESTTEGTEYIRISASGDLKAATTQPFPDNLPDFVSDRMLERQDGKRMPGPHMSPFDAFAEDDGSTVMVCDYRYQVAMAHYSSNGFNNPGMPGYNPAFPAGGGYYNRYRYTDTIYYNLDITSVKFTPDGKIDWVKPIPLYRVAEGMSSVIGQLFFKSGNNYNFIYCDSRKNFIKSKDKEGMEPKEWENSKKYIVEMGSLDYATGSIQRSMLFDAEEQKVGQMMSYTQSVHIAGTNGVVLYGIDYRLFKGVRYRFVQITM